VGARTKGNEDCGSIITNSKFYTTPSDCSQRDMFSRVRALITRWTDPRDLIGV
jgi:hypothetical protein